MEEAYYMFGYSCKRKSRKWVCTACGVPHAKAAARLGPWSPSIRFLAGGLPMSVSDYAIR